MSSSNKIHCGYISHALVLYRIQNGHHGDRRNASNLKKGKRVWISQPVDFVTTRRGLIHMQWNHFTETWQYLGKIWRSVSKTAGCLPHVMKSTNTPCRWQYILAPQIGLVELCSADVAPMAGLPQTRVETLIGSQAELEIKQLNQDTLLQQVTLSAQEKTIQN